MNELIVLVDCCKVVDVRASVGVALGRMASGGCEVCFGNIFWCDGISNGDERMNVILSGFLMESGNGIGVCYMLGTYCFLLSFLLMRTMV
jgi:hypothetical protein